VATYPKEVIARGPNAELLASIESGQPVQNGFGKPLPPPSQAGRR
jgi:hypothetical protein